MPERQTGMSGQPTIFMYVASLGLAFASMKQLKFIGGLIGPGEIILAISIAWVILSRGRIYLSAIKFTSMPVFLMLAMASIMTLSTLLNLAFISAPGANYISDMTSVWASILMVIFLALASTSTRILLLILCWSAVFTVLISSSLLAYSALTGSTHVVGMPLFYWGTRFQGLSPDPNQLARICATAPFLSLIIMQNAPRSIRLVCYAAIASSIYVGIETESQSCWLAWAAGALGAIGMYLLRPEATGAAKRNKVTLRMLGKTAAVGAALAVVISILPAAFGQQSGSPILTYLASTGGSDRTHVAALSLAQIAVHPAFGLGFGQHISWATTYAGTYIIESHNAFLDVAVRGGLPTLLILVMFSIAAFKGALRTNSAPLLAALIATVIFGMGITPIRQPTYWLILALAAGSAYSQQYRALLLETPGRPRRNSR